MRGIVSEKLTEFLTQVNIAADEAKQNNIQFTPELVRGNLEKLAAFLPKGAELAFVDNRTLLTATHEIPVRVYSPAPNKKLPVVIHFHGGGHMCGSVELYDPISRRIALEANCIVICVDYRLAPEHPYPAGIDDCQYAIIHYKDVLQGVKYSDQLYTLGDSAGGAICTTLAMRALTIPEIKIDKQILIYPSVDYTMRMDSLTENGQGFLLEQARIAWYFDNYFQHNESLSSVSPLYNMHDKLPESLVITAGCDPLRDEGLAYVQAIRDMAIDVEHMHFDGMIHAYMLLEGLVKEECAKSYQKVANFINMSK